MGDLWKVFRKQLFIDISRSPLSFSFCKTSKLEAGRQYLNMAAALILVFVSLLLSQMGSSNGAKLEFPNPKRERENVMTARERDVTYEGYGDDFEYPFYGYDEYRGGGEINMIKDSYRM